MSFEYYSADKLAKLRGGNSENFSVFNYRPPGYNYASQIWEKHFPLDNYEGPGTWVQDRWVNRKLRGTNPVDDASRLHDIQYNNLGLARAKNLIDKQQLEKGIQNSDQQLLQSANRNMVGVNPLTVASAIAAQAGIRGKRGLQNFGLMDKTAFTGSNRNAKFIDEQAPRNIEQLPPAYLGTGFSRPTGFNFVEKKDRLKNLRKSFKKTSIK